MMPHVYIVGSAEGFQQMHLNMWEVHRYIALHDADALHGLFHDKEFRLKRAVFKNVQLSRKLHLLLFQETRWKLPDSMLDNVHPFQISDSSRGPSRYFSCSTGALIFSVHLKSAD